MTSRIGNPDTDADRELRACLDQTPVRSFIMVAGAGSGKTTSLVKALDHLVRTRGAGLRRQGQQIACITYTEVAVGEISGDVGNESLCHVSTIHSFLWTVVRPFQSDLRSWVGARIAGKIDDAETRIANRRTREATRQTLTRDVERYRAQLGELASVRAFRYGTGSDYAEGILGHDDILKIGPTLITDRPLLRALVAKRFPYIFVDESQDTDPSFVAALRLVAETVSAEFCLGFFGDPMQKIYLTGAGCIEPGVGWNQITKPENFRCPISVLKVINNIRNEDDKLEQVRGRLQEINGVASPVQGSARLFIVPADGRRRERLTQVRRWLAKANADPLWAYDGEDANVRVLVLVHRTAAARLGFSGIYAALNDRAPESLKSGLKDGTAWPLRPFMTYVLPLVQMVRSGADFDVMVMLRKNCPLLDEERLAGENVAQLMARLKVNLITLSEMLAPTSACTIKQVLAFVSDRGLASLDDRFGRFFGDALADVLDGDASVVAFIDCPAAELWGYKTYIDDESPFSTQQGIKGTEFQRVLVILDDEEGDYNLFCYGKYFGTIPLSKTDEEHQDAGKDSVVERTRRLFYVCCSRAVNDLAVIYVVPDVATAREAVFAKGLFEPDNVHVIDG